MPNLGFVSTFNINGNELSLKDAALTEIVEEIIKAIGANNGDISERINNLHERSFDALIKISSGNESEISNIKDGMYKLQYVTVTSEGDTTVESLNNSAILIQNGTNQYLYKDGTISSRSKLDSTWGSWIKFEGGVTSVNGMTGAVNIDIPSKTSDLTNDSNFTTLAEVRTEIVGAAPEQLNTLSELADALNNDQNFAAKVTDLIGQKYSKPSTGIPASDIAEGVIPEVPVKSVNGQTGDILLSLGDENIIETIKVNNNQLTPVNKAVNITVPTKVSDLTNDSNFTSNIGTITGITMNGVSKGTSGVINLGTVLTEHQDISGKVDKVTGMGLSSNDYTTEEKTKLAGINIGDLSNLTTTELNSIFATA